ncbi:hypothetical protein V6N13_019338 [Hibiscus sabdariffa]
MESVGLREVNVESPGHGQPKGKEKLERCYRSLHYQVPYIGQGSFGVAYASLGKSEPWPCPVGGGVRDPRSANHSRLWSCRCTISLALCYLPRHCHPQYWKSLRGNSSIGGCE